MSNFAANTIDAKKIAEVEKESDYIYPPLKRSFKPCVRITTYVIVAYRKFKKKMVIQKMKRNEPVSDGSTLTDINFQPAKFISFPVIQGGDVVTQDITDSISLCETFEVNAVHVRSDMILKLTDDELSEGLNYIFKKATDEVLKYHSKKYIDKRGIMIDGILFSKDRILEGQQLKIVGGLEKTIDLHSLTGISFKVPLIHKNSPLAVSIANHLHFNVIKHMGAESVYRLSLQYVKILNGRSLFKYISDNCIYCKMLRTKYLRQIMGPLTDYQLSISPLFYYCYVDAYGPIKAYVPGYERQTRSGDKTVELLILTFCCAATSMVNLQVIEGGKNTGNFLEGFNRFFCECTVPKVCFPDKDGALVKIMREAEITVESMDGVFSREKGMNFRLCPSQGHSSHGKIEVKIRTVQETFERAGFKNKRLHALGWQTIAKQIEREVNSIPIGYLIHDGESAAPLLKILRPNLLKTNTASERAPATIFTVPERANDLFKKVEDIYNLWYKIYVDSYVPLLAQRSKWIEEGENLIESDVVYFKLRDSPLHSKWIIGKVEYVVPSRDGKVRTVGIGYKFDTTDGERTFKIVERPVREVVKLMHIDDTSILDDIKNVHNQARKEFDMQRLVTSDEILDTVSYTMTGSLDDYCCTNYLTPQKYPFFVYTIRDRPIPRDFLFETENLAYMMNRAAADDVTEEIVDKNDELNWFFDAPEADTTDDEFADLALL